MLLIVALVSIMLGALLLAETLKEIERRSYAAGVAYFVLVVVFWFTASVILIG